MRDIKYGYRVDSLHMGDGVISGANRGCNPFLVSDRIESSLTPLSSVESMIFGKSREHNFPLSREERRDLRQQQFTKGRACASELLRKMGAHSLHVGVTSNRAPIWPLGYLGSITHTDKLVGVAVARTTETLGLGIDLEEIVTVEAANEIGSLCLNDREKSLLPKTDSKFRVFSTLMFSSKEALYKCLYPLTGQFFDFLDAEIVEISESRNDMSIALRRRLSESFTEGQTFHGHFHWDQVNVYTSFEMSR